MEELLSYLEKSSKGNYKIYPGNFDSLFGSYNLNKKVINNIYNEFSKIFKNITNFNQTIYSYNNMRMIIDKYNNNIFIKKNIISEKLFKNFYVELEEIQSIEKEQFPFINKYHNIVYQNINRFRDNDFEILLISENDDNTNYILINTTNKNDFLPKILDI